MADVSGPQGSSGSLYTSSVPKNNWKHSATALLGGILRKIKKVNINDLPFLKTQQPKSTRLAAQPPRSIKLRTAMEAEPKLFIQVLPQDGRHPLAPATKPGTTKHSSTVPGQQEQLKSAAQVSQRKKKPGPPVAPRKGNSAPKRPQQPKVPLNELVQSRQKPKSTPPDTSKPTAHSEPLYENTSASSDYENVSGGKPFRYHVQQYENVTVQDESDYVSAEDIQKMRQEQLRKKEKPTPAPKPTRKENNRQENNNQYSTLKPTPKTYNSEPPAGYAKLRQPDIYNTLDRDIAPKPTPQTYNSESPAGYAKQRQPDIYDVPDNGKTKPAYDVPHHLKTPAGYDSPQNQQVKQSGHHDLKIRSNPAYRETAPSLPTRNSVTSRFDSIDPVTEDNIYEPIGGENFELEIWDKSLQDDGSSLNDASRLRPLLNDLVQLEREMPTLISTFKSRRPSKANPFQWVAHMQQERLLIQQNLDNKGFDKLKNSLQFLINEGLTTAQERNQVRRQIARINAALDPALTIKYGIDGARARLLKAPEG